MSWHEMMQELENKVEGTLQGTYRPLDNVPFFRVQYPPIEEREALREFKSLMERLSQKGWTVESISLTELFKEALAALRNCLVTELIESLKVLEKERDRKELQRLLSDYLPDEISKVIAERFGKMSQKSVLVLLRMGALYPFIRSSSLFSKLEGKVQCAVILPYPGMSLGALLDTPPADPHGGYYRGEVIAWK